MQYMVSCLVLGDAMVALDNLNNIGFQNIEKSEISKWEKNIQWRDNEINVNIDVPVVSNAPFEDLIPMADGIIYYLNPNKYEDLRLFRDIIDIVRQIRRNIPTIVIFHDKNHFIKLSGNHLLYWIWEEYPFEAWIYDLPHLNPVLDFLDSLMECIIEGETLINYNTSWLQIPVLKAKANEFIYDKDWKNAARVAKKIAKIKRKFDKSDWTIYAEKSSWLFSRARDFLSAAKCIEDFNSEYAQKYREMYVDELIHRGQKMYSKNKFVESSKQYEKAGNWAKLELSDKEKMKKAYRSAIYSWLSACDIPSAFRLLEHFDHVEQKEILNEITEKIAGAADFLSKNQNYELAKSHLYLTLTKYQKAGLFDEVKILANKTVKILESVLNEHIRNKDPDSAKMTIDEIENIWETFEANKENIDPLLSQVCRLFIERRDFQKVDELLPKIDSIELKEELTEARMDEEERIKEEVQKGKNLSEKEALERIYDYVKYEEEQFSIMNEKIFHESERLVKSGNPLKATNHIKEQSEWLISIGKEDLAHEVLTKALDIALEGEILGKFLREIQNLPEKKAKDYLEEKKERIQKLLHGLSNKVPISRFEEMSIKMIKLYRNQLLYDEAKIYADLLIDALKKYGSEIEKHISDKIKIRRSLLNLTHKINQISKGYLDEKEPDMDLLYEKIIQSYLKDENLLEARKYSDKLIDKETANYYYNKIDNIDSKRQSSRAAEYKKQKELDIYSEQLTRLKKLSFEQKREQEDLLRMRNGLKRYYFQKGLDMIKADNPLEAAEVYGEVSKKLIKSKKIELAGISTAISTMLYLLVKKPHHIQKMIDSIDSDLGLGKDIFHETFPIKVVDYILNMYGAKKYMYIKPALKLLDGLALFPEEKLMLKTLIGETSSLKEMMQKHKKVIETSENEITNEYNVLINELRYDPHHYSKRNALEEKYWGDCRDFLARQQYAEAHQAYLNMVFDLFQRTEKRFAINSIVLSFLSLLKIRNSHDVLREFEKYIFQLEKKYHKVSDNPTIKLLGILLENIDEPDHKKEVLEILSAFENKLILFDWEKSLIENIKSGLKKTADSSSVSMRKTVGVGNGAFNVTDNSLLQDQIIVLTQEISEMQDKFDDILEKRKRMIRAYYRKAIDYLKDEEYKQAIGKYERLAKRMARRNDFDRASLMVLLSCLCGLKSQIGLDDIKNNIDSLLKSLGHVRKILDDTIGVKISNFLLDVKKINDASIQNHLNDILSRMPLLEEEKRLIG